MSTKSSQQTDMLTGLLTRKVFHEIFNDLLDKAKGKSESIVLALVDIDHFKPINDQYGHPAGDEVIKTVAKQIEADCGPDAICVRYGGDEFAVIFPNIEREQAFLTLEKLRINASQLTFKFDDSDAIGGIALSGGLACYPVDGRLKSELLRKADQALYRAKESGRSNIRLAYDEKMVPKTSHYTQTQLERLSKLAAEREVGEAELLREALDDLLTKFGVNRIEHWG